MVLLNQADHTCYSLAIELLNSFRWVAVIIMSLFVWLFLGCVWKVHFVLNWVPYNTKYLLHGSRFVIGYSLSGSVLSWVKIHSFILNFPSSSKGSISLASFVAFSVVGTLSIMSSIYLITRAASGYLPSPISAVFHNETVAIVPEGLSPNETLCVTHVSGGLAVSVSLYRDLCICCSI